MKASQQHTLTVTYVPLDRSQGSTRRHGTLVFIIQHVRNVNQLISYKQLEMGLINQRVCGQRLWAAKKASTSGPEQKSLRWRCCSCICDTGPGAALLFLGARGTLRHRRASSPSAPRRRPASCTQRRPRRRRRRLLPAATTPAASPPHHCSSGRPIAACACGACVRVCVDGWVTDRSIEMAGAALLASVSIEIVYLLHGGRPGRVYIDERVGVRQLARAKTDEAIHPLSLRCDRIESKSNRRCVRERERAIPPRPRLVRNQKIDSFGVITCSSVSQYANYI